MKPVKLFAPAEFWQLTKEQRNEICNSCGPKGFDWLIPDSLCGLSVKAACEIHDFMYYAGETIADKEQADRTFLNNMLRIIEANTEYEWLKCLRKHMAYKYYCAVRNFGGPAFWEGKNAPEELGLVFA